MFEMDRKALKKQYQETQKVMGVCCVRNTANGRLFLECSRDVKARLNRHQAELMFGKHLNARLQEDWSRFGPEAFSFEIIDVLSPLDKPGYDPADDLDELFSLWIDKLQPFGDKGYNT